MKGNGFVQPGAATFGSSYSDGVGPVDEQVGGGRMFRGRSIRRVGPSGAVPHHFLVAQETGKPNLLSDNRQRHVVPAPLGLVREGLSSQASNVNLPVFDAQTQFVRGREIRRGGRASSVASERQMGLDHSVEPEKKGGFVRNAFERLSGLRRSISRTRNSKEPVELTKFGPPAVNTPAVQTPLPCALIKRDILENLKKVAQAFKGGYDVLVDYGKQEPEKAIALATQDRTANQGNTVRLTDEKGTAREIERTIFRRLTTALKGVADYKTLRLFTNNNKESHAQWESLESSPALTTLVNRAANLLNTPVPEALLYKGVGSVTIQLLGDAKSLKKVNWQAEGLKPFLNRIADECTRLVASLEETLEAIEQSDSEAASTDPAAQQQEETPKSNELVALVADIRELVAQYETRPTQVVVPVSRKVESETPPREIKPIRPAPPPPSVSPVLAKSVGLVPLGPFPQPEKPIPMSVRFRDVVTPDELVSALQCLAFYIADGVSILSKAHIEKIRTFSETVARQLTPGEAPDQAAQKLRRIAGTSKLEQAIEQIEALPEEEGLRYAQAAHYLQMGQFGIDSETRKKINTVRSFGESIVKKQQELEAKLLELEQPKAEMRTEKREQLEAEIDMLTGELDRLESERNRSRAQIAIDFYQLTSTPTR